MGASASACTSASRVDALVKSWRIAFSAATSPGGNASGQPRRAHRDVVRRPRADPGKRTQPFDQRLGRRAGRRTAVRAHPSARRAPGWRRAAADDAELGDALDRHDGEIGRPRERAIDRRATASRAQRRSARQAARERSRCRNGHLLAEHGAHGELERVDAAGQAQARLARQADERLGRSSPALRRDRASAARRRSRHRSSAPSDGANESWTRDPRRPRNAPRAILPTRRGRRLGRFAGSRAGRSSRRRGSRAGRRTRAARRRRTARDSRALTVIASPTTSRADRCADRVRRVACDPRRGAAQARRVHAVAAERTRR